jgi:signal transduction histidine kinase
MTAQPWFHWRFLFGIPMLILAAGLALFAVPIAHTDSGEVRELHEAHFLASNLETPPPADAAGWKPMGLPDLWSNRWAGTSGWYRLTLHTEVLPERLQALYLFRVNMNAGVWFNREFVGDGGSMRSPLSVNWNTPLYFKLPRPLWRTGENEILIHLRSYEGFGMLAPVQLGADETLRERYNWRIFIQNELSQTFTATLTVVGLFALGLWLRRRRDTLYLWFALSSFCWALFNLRLFVVNPVIPESAFRWLSHSAIDFWMVFLLVFMHRYLGLIRPRLEWGLAMLQAVFAALHGLPEPPHGYWITPFAHGLTLLTAIYLTWISWESWRRRLSRELLITALAFTGLVLAGLHDWLMENSLPGLLAWETLVAMWRHQIHLLYLLAPALILVLAWHLTGRFVAALNESEELNRELENRVDQAQTALARSYALRHNLEMSQAAAQEREQIYRNLHDDIGAKLLSLVIGADTPARADIARSALQDLRDVVSRSGQGPQPLSFLLADWRNEMETRLGAAGLKFTWSLADDLPDPLISPSAALHLGRVLREGVSNILRHAQARQVEAHFETGQTGLIATLEDDGKGPPQEINGAGRGMRNMRARVEQLQGTIAWDAGRLNGCRLYLNLPWEGLERN